MVHYGKEIKAAPLAMSKNPKHGKEQPAAPESPSSALRLELLGSFEVYVLKGFLALPPFPPDLAKIMGPQRLTFPFGTDFEVFVRKVGGIIFRIDDLDDAKKFVIKNGKAERVESGAMEMELRFCYVVGQHSSSNPGCTHTIPKTISSYEDYREMLEHMASVADDPDGKFVVIWQPGKAPRDKITVARAAHWNQIENHRLRERKRCPILSRAKVIIGGNELWIPERVIGIHDDVDNDRMVRVRWVDTEKETAEFLLDAENNFPSILDAFYEDSGKAPDRTGSLGNRRAVLFGDAMETEQREQFSVERKLEKLMREKKEGLESTKKLDDDPKETEEWARECKVLSNKLELIKEQIDYYRKEVEMAKKRVVAPRKRFEKEEAKLNRELELAGRQLWREEPDSGIVDVSAYGLSPAEHPQESQDENSEPQMSEKRKWKQRATRTEQQGPKENENRRGGKKQEVKHKKSEAFEKQAEASEESDEWEQHDHLLGASATATEAWRHARRGGYVNYAEGGATSSQANGIMRQARGSVYDRHIKDLQPKDRAAAPARRTRHVGGTEPIDIDDNGSRSRAGDEARQSRRDGRINYIEISDDDEDDLSEGEDDNDEDYRLAE